MQKALGLISSTEKQTNKNTNKTSIQITEFQTIRFSSYCTYTRDPLIYRATRNLRV
jgi:hypothetical protein